MRRIVVVVGLLGALACTPPPPPPSEKAQAGEDCSDDSCEKGLACVNLGDDAAPLCAEPPAACDDPDDLCGCDELSELCPDGSAGNGCISFGSKVELECFPPGGEGEGEGEGE
ncbi:MAG: hypothetical protein Q8O67_27175 [Deltaproteobacteria bacterium]|nr:hypothetical protein [Deltaproteobacteria bacterium]